MIHRTHSPQSGTFPILALASLGLTVFVLLAGWAAPAVAADQERATMGEYQTWVHQMDAYYDAHPELKTTPGSGWKPYNRYKWFNQSRLGPDGELPEPGARVRAMQHRLEAESRGIHRSSSSWFSLGPTNFAGRMLAIDFDPTDPSIIYAGAASGGAWKSTDGGDNWFPIADDLPAIAVGGIAVNKTDASNVVLGTGEPTPNVDAVGGVGIYYSTDSGATWTASDLTYSPGGFRGFHVVESGPDGSFLAGADDGLWRSTDGGATWTQVRVGGDYYDVKWKPGDPNTVYTVKGSDAAGNGVKISTDNGATWTGAGTGQPSTFTIGKSKLAVTAANPQYVYAFYGENSTGGGTTGVYRSTDGGATWNARNTGGNLVGGQSWYNLVCAADPDNAERVFIGGVGMFRSVNGGTTFSSIAGNVHVDHHALAYVPGSNSELWVGNDGGIWRSTDDGSSWLVRNNGLVSYQFYDICVNNNGSTPYYIMGGTQDNGTDKWSGTTTWSNGLGADGMVCNIDPTNGTTVYAEIQFGDHRKNLSSGSGGIWIGINNGISGNGAWVAPVDQDQNNGDHLYTATSAGIFRTLNGGTLWSNVTSSGATWISISPVDGNVVWKVLGGAAPQYTTNDGSTWNSASSYGFPTGPGTKILTHPTDLNTVVVTFGSYTAGLAHVAYTTDGGATWNNGTGNLGNEPVNAIAIDPSNPDDWYVGTDTGVWYSSDHGANWTPFETGLPNVVIADLEIQDAQRKLVAGTHGRGAWEIDIPPTVTGADVVVSTRPHDLMLDAPFPNPVSDRTMLRFAAKSAGKVTLAIYDVAGRMVSPLAELASGDGVIRTTPWFADDVPNGVYFAVLRADGQKMTRKVVVAK